MTSNNGLNIRVYFVLGLIIGVLIDLLFFTQLTYFYPYFVILASGLLFAIAFDGRQSLPLLIKSTIASLIAFLPVMSVSLTMSLQKWLELNVMLAGLPILVYAVHSFNYACHLDSTYKASYKSLFFAVWNTIPIIVIASVFTAISKALIFLTTIIFSTLKYQATANFLTSNPHFIFIANITLFFIGIGIAKQSIKVLDSLRFVMLRIIYYLYPFLAIISVLFFCLYLAHGMSSNLQVDMNQIILFSLAAYGVIFFNAIFQDGTQQTQYPTGLKYFLKFYRLIMFGLAILLMKAMFLPMLSNINLWIYAIILLTLTGCYAVTALLPLYYEIAWVKRINVTAALFLIVSMVVVNNPILPLTTYFSKQHVTIFDGFAGALQPQSDIDSLKEDDVHQAFSERNLKNKLNQQDTLLRTIGGSWKDAEEPADNATDICRAFFNRGYQIGVIANDQCRITYGGHIFKLPDYQYLDIPEDNIKWQSPEQNPSIALGVEFNEKGGLRVLSACKVKIHGYTFQGKTVAGRCNIAKSGQEKAYPEYLVLTADRF